MVDVPDSSNFDAVGAAISFGLCLLVSVLFGLLPAVRFSRPNLISAMKDDAGGGDARLFACSVAAMLQIGIAIPFLVMSGVMLDRVRTADFGFSTDGLAAARLPTPGGSEREAASSLRRGRDDLQQASGVRSVALADGMPVDFDDLALRVATEWGGVCHGAGHARHKSSSKTIGAPLVRGRAITA